MDRPWIALMAVVGTTALANGCGADARPNDREDAGGPATPSPDAAEADARPTGLPSRPANPSCLAPTKVPEIGSEGLAARLSQTGCFDPLDPTRPLPALIPYEVNAPLWSDGATKQRWLALPDAGRIQIKADGDFDFPPGTVTIKTFLLAGRPIETRFFVRLMSGEWAGYTYEWNEAGTDAVVLYEGSRRRTVGDREWHYPTRAECLQCHTEGAGRTLGLELAQLDGEFTHPEGKRVDQLATWEQMGLFEAAVPTGSARPTPLPRPEDVGASLETRARAYLHANCSNCHRPGMDGSGTTDFRFAIPLAETMSCDAEPLRGVLGAGQEARIIAPARPDQSMIIVRMLELGAGRMPEVASLMVDQQGITLLSDWIRSLGRCP